MTSRFVLPLADVGSGLTPSSGAQLFFYETGTTTPKDTYSDSAGTTPNANPVVANSVGVFDDIFISGTYKVVLKNAANIQQWAADPISEFVTGSGQENNVLSRATLAEAVADNSLSAGLSVNIAERTTGNGGGGMWDVVLASSVTPNTYNIVQCTGDATLALVLRDGGVGNVVQWGADPTNTVDSQPAIQACIDANNSVLIPIGGYKIASTITVGPGTRVEGENVKVTANAQGAVLFIEPAITGMRITTVATTPLSGVMVRHLSFRGKTTSHDQVFINLGNSDNVVVGEGAWQGYIDRCTFDGGRIGILGSHSQSFHITECVFGDMSESFIQYDSTCASAIISGCQFDANGTYDSVTDAIRAKAGVLGGSSGFTVDSNYFISCRYGVFMADVRGAIVSNNTFEGLQDNCIRMHKTDWNGSDEVLGCRGCNITNNSFVVWGANASAKAAISVQYSGDNFFRGNSFSNPWGLGGSDIFIYQLYDNGTGTCSGNWFDWPVATGINSEDVRPFPNSSTVVKQNNIIGGPIVSLQSVSGIDTADFTSSYNGAFIHETGNINPSIYHDSAPGIRELLAGSEVTASAGAITDYTTVNISGVDYKIALYAIA